MICLLDLLFPVYLVFWLLVFSTANGIFAVRPFPTYPVIELRVGDNDLGVFFGGKAERLNGNGQRQGVEKKGALGTGGPERAANGDAHLRVMN